MEYLISDQDHFEQGLFILRSHRAPYVPFVNNHGLVLTQRDKPSLKNRVLGLIEGSKQVLKICSFIITDQDIFDSLLQKARTTRVAIFILTQLDPSKLYSSPMFTE